MSKTKNNLEIDTLKCQVNILESACLDSLFNLMKISDSKNLDVADCVSTMRCVMARLEIALDLSEKHHAK